MNYREQKESMILTAIEVLMLFCRFWRLGDDYRHGKTSSF